MAIECMKCHKEVSGRHAHVHHKDHNPENNNETNLMILCDDCHWKFHKGEWTYEEFGLVDVYDKSGYAKSKINERTRENQKLYVRIKHGVFAATKRMLAEQGAAIAGVPGVEIKLTTYVNELLINDLAKRGHYPPKITDAVEPK